MSCLYHAFLLSLTACLLTLYLPFYHMMCRFSLKSRPRHQKSLLNTCRFILDFVSDRSAKYNITTKEEKDPKSPYATSTCSTNLLSSKLNLYMHWKYTDPYRKAIVIKLDVLKQPSPIHVHIQQTGHNIVDNSFNIIGREDQGQARTIKESIYIRLNNPTLNQNIGKYNLSHIWHRVLFNTPGLKLGSSHQPVS